MPVRRSTAWPVTGLRYPQAVSFGSNLTPKPLGSYEQELHPLFADILTRPYEQIIDVECAKGYYAIGLARCLPQATVYAFDIEARDLTMTVAMTVTVARANGVAERLKIGGIADEKSLSEIDLSKRTLLISDCEGGGAALFTPQFIACLGNTDVLIELHEMYVDNVAQQMADRFAAMHQARYVDSVDDCARLGVCVSRAGGAVLAGSLCDLGRDTRSDDGAGFFDPKKRDRIISRPPN